MCHLCTQIDRIGFEGELPYPDLQVQGPRRIGQVERSVAEGELPHDGFAAHERQQCDIGPQRAAGEKRIARAGNRFGIVDGQPQREFQPQPLDAEPHVEMIGDIGDRLFLDEILYRGKI